MNTWETAPLSEVLTFREGPGIMAQDFRDRGIPLLRLAGLKPGHSLLEGCNFLDACQVEAKWSQFRLRRDDVLLSTSASLGEVAVVDDEVAGAIPYTGIVAFRPADHRVNARFIPWLLRAPSFKAQIEMMGVGSVMKHFGPMHLRQMTVDFPDLRQQSAIAEVLGALDDKIAANSRLVASAEGLSSARFSSLARDVLAPLSQVAEFVNGRNFTKDASGTGRVVIRIAELNSGLGGSTVYADLDAPANNVAGPGSLLFAWSGSLTVKRWFLGEGLVNQHIFKVLPREHYPMWLVHQLLLEGLDAFRAIAADKATTMGHIQRGHLDVAVRVPDPATIEANHDVMQGLWDRSLAAEVESVKLAELRDALLPLLMAGQVRVRDAERDVERVL